MNSFFIKTGLYVLLTCCLLIVLTGCTLPGEVYISFSWVVDRDMPDNIFQCDVPNIPDDFNDIKKGAYYFTSIGEYTISYNYSDDTFIRTKDITLKLKETVLGKENAYYDFVIRREGPEFYEVPQ
ncbi:MAG: hypothetical protein JXB88_02010 [Spirochaetales bacterium]|nr:hypothetical protein [Spirochaetales bacterium]